MSRRSTALILFAGCLIWSFAQACEIKDARPGKLGADKAVSGKCPNGLRISCEYNEDEGWSCDGPEGNYSGAATLEAAVAPACGCR